MDRTPQFRAAVMAIKLQRKGEQDKNRILPSVTPRPAQNAMRDEFTKQAKDVCHKISTLRNVLLENRAAYMRIGQHLKNAAQMTDEQRDLIDRESEKFVTYYTQYLAKMRTDWKHVKRKPQHREHMDCVMDLLAKYLLDVQQIYLEQKKYRVHHELETYRLLKLAADKKKIPVRPAASEKSAARAKTTSIGDSETDYNNEDSDANSDIDLSDGWQIEEQQEEAQKLRISSEVDLNKSGVDIKNLSSQKVALDEDMNKSQQLNDEAAQVEKLSPEDVQMFEQENTQLYQELQGFSSDVEQIEKNVVDIAQLQDIFTEKVSLQNHNIERIANAVVGATENVKDANEQIKQAIQRNAGLRVWSLFFLLVMSFALLFLDWYYD